PACARSGTAVAWRVNRSPSTPCRSTGCRRGCSTAWSRAARSTSSCGAGYGSRGTTRTARPPADSARETVGRRHQGIDGFRLERRMAGGRGDHQFRPRPGLVQVPGVLHRAHDVVAPVVDHAGDVGDPAGVAQQLVVDFEEPAVDEIVVLDPGEGQGEMRVLMAGGEILVDMQEAGRALPHAP